MSVSDRGGRARGGQAPGWLVVVGRVLAMPLRVLLVTRVLLPTMDQRPSILSPDDPLRPGYRTPPIDVTAGEAVPGAEPAVDAATARALSFLERFERQPSDLE